MTTIQTHIDHINQAEAKLLNMPQAECSVTHTFEDGFCIREVHMKKGTLAIGHHQNFAQVNVFVSGRVLMLDEDGSTVVLEAPMTYIGPPGRKVGLMLEDVVWRNIYKTDIKDGDEIEEHFLTKSQSFQDKVDAEFLVEYVKQEPLRIEFQRTLLQLGYTQKEVDAEVFQDDLVDMPDGTYKFQQSRSPIHGQGVFATGSMENGEVVGAARIGGNRTILGRFVNHSSSPNCKMLIAGDCINLVTTRDIHGNLGGQLGEELTVDYAQAVATRNAFDGRIDDQLLEKLNDQI